MIKNSLINFLQVNTAYCLLWYWAFHRTNAQSIQNILGFNIVQDLIQIILSKSKSVTNNKYFRASFI
jgi:hypothetical protein